MHVQPHIRFVRYPFTQNYVEPSEYTSMLYVTFLGACALTTSVCPHVTARLLLDRFPWQFILMASITSVEKLEVLLKSDKNIRHFSWDLNTVSPATYFCRKSSFCATLNICKFLTMPFSSTLRTELRALFDYNSRYENVPQYYHTYIACLLKAHTGG